MEKAINLVSGIKEPHKTLKGNKKHFLHFYQLFHRPVSLEIL